MINLFQFSIRIRIAAANFSLFPFRFSLFTFPFSLFPFHFSLNKSNPVS